MGKKIVAISLALVMVLSFTACEGEELPPAQEIVDGAIEALGDIRTYQFDIDFTMDMAGEAEGESFDVNVEGDASGALDLDNTQMRMDIAVNAVVPEEDEMDMEMGVYLVGDTLYIMTEEPGEEPVWEKDELSGTKLEEAIEALSMAKPYMELLELAEVEVTGSEKVGGVDCYVVKVTPDVGLLWQLVTQQTEIAGGMPYIDEEFLDEVFRSYSVKQWIAKDTHFLVKAEMEMAMELTPEALGASGGEGEMTMDIAISMLVYEYNQPVSIELPPEAEEAVETHLGF